MDGFQRKSTPNTIDNSKRKTRWQIIPVSISKITKSEEVESFVVLGTNGMSSKARAAALKKATAGTAAATSTTTDRFKNKSGSSNSKAANALAVAAAKKSFKLDLDILKKN